MKIYGLHSYLDDSGYWPPVVANSENSITVDYRPNTVSALQAGQEDRFYVAGTYINNVQPYVCLHHINRWG